MKSKIINYVISIIIFAGVLGASFYFKDSVYHSFEKNPESHLLVAFFLVGLLSVLGSLISHVSRLVKLPSFVIAIFFGLAASPFLSPILEKEAVLGVLVGLGAALILFGGGIETPFKNFKKLMGQILSLSFPGLLITAFLTSVLIYAGSNLLGSGISLVTAVLLGAVLASTDPAAIIPILKRLKFNNRSVKDIIVSESAFTDVTGALLTGVFLTLVVAGVGFDSITAWYGSIFTLDSGVLVMQKLFFGVLLGVLGYFLLEFLLRFKKKNDYGHEADLSFFLFVPIMIFAFATALGGSGYLAAFITGLLFHMTDHLKETEHFFNNLVEGFLKPTIFILLGAMVDITKLLEYAPIGILIGLLFMLVVRPVSAFISLTVFRYFGKEKMSFRDIWFISAIRETGAIPAVLLVTIVSLALPGTEGLLEVGMWVILCTLVIAPPLTPKIAQWLKVATTMKDDENLVLPAEPSVMIVSRGYGFTNRLTEVVDYALKNNINKVILLLCLEQKYTPELEKEIQKVASDKFKTEKKRLDDIQSNDITFEFISRKGLLEDNIDFISEMKDSPVAVIFAGKRILDYHLDEVKQLSIPMRFVD